MEEEKYVLQSIYTQDELELLDSLPFCDQDPQTLTYRFYVNAPTGNRAQLDVTLDGTYPQSIPHVHLQVQRLDTERNRYVLNHNPTTERLLETMRPLMHEQLTICRTESEGQVYLYNFFEWFRDVIQERLEEIIAVSKSSAVNEKPSGAAVEEVTLLASSDPPLVDRHSVFIAHCARIQNLQQIEKVKECLMASDPRMLRATHHILAYRFLHAESGVHADYDDDGETSAGKRLLHFLQMTECMNVIVVVSRWYGGVQLGSDRFKHIQHCAQRVLKEHGFIQRHSTS